MQLKYLALFLSLAAATGAYAALPLSREIKGQQKEIRFQPTVAADGSFAKPEFRAIKVTRGGKTVKVEPLGDQAHSYLWPSLSADGSKLLFSEPFKGVYVANPDGTEPRRILSKGDFCAWAGKNTVIAVQSTDDGYVITSGRLVAVDIRTLAVTPLTPENVIVGEAAVTAEGVVEYNTLDGRTFTINLNDFAL